MAPAFKRILLKLSGEALMGELDYGTDPERVVAVARQVAAVRDQGVEVAIVVGAGNIYRGMQGAAAGMDRATAGYMGMLASVVNALPLAGATATARCGRPRYAWPGAPAPPPPRPPPTDTKERAAPDAGVQSALGVSE